MSSPNLEAALDYRRRDWMPVPVYPKEKRPIGEGWQNLRLDESNIPQHFNDGQNVGVLLGEPSGGLVDIDLDCEEAIALADVFLPPTGAVFGRSGRPSSHRIYTVKLPPVGTERFVDPEGKTTLVEMRSTGGQTVFPPSIHPSGEQVTWARDDGPEEVDGSTLRPQVARLAAAALLVRHWPRINGSRQDIALALAGGLSRAGWGEEDVADFIGAVADAADDEESEKRAEASKHTARHLAQDLPTTGWPRLAELLGEKVVGKVCEWLGVQRQAWGEQSRTNSDEAGEAEQGRTKVKWVTAREFVAEQPEDVEWLWEGYVAPGNVTVISARPKGGKTTLVFHLLAALMGGRDFLGKATRQGKVLVMSEEPSNLIRRRLANLGLTSDDLLIAKRSDVTGWDDALALVQDAIEYDRLDLLVIDVLAAFWGIDDENGAGKVMAALQPLLKLAQKAEMAVLLLHHLRKSPGAEGTASRGSSALAGSADILVEIHRDEHAARRRKLTAYSRYEETPRDVLVELGDEGYRLLGKSADVKKVAVKLRAVAAMPGGPPGKTQAEIREDMEPSPSPGMLSEALKEAEDEGSAKRSGAGRKGDPYRYWRVGEGADSDELADARAEEEAA